MSEKFWQKEKDRVKSNKSNIHPVIQQSYDDNRSIVPNYNFRESYYNCNQGDLNLKALEKSDDITLDDLGFLLCRDAGCELQYCQSSMIDQNERPFKNCEEQYKKFNQCQEQEKKRYLYENDGKISIKEHLNLMLEKKKYDNKNRLNELEMESNKQIQTEMINRGEKENQNPNEKKQRKIFINEKL
jgi:hypothetical protein